MISLQEGQGSGKKALERVFTLQLSIVGTKPPVWRKLIVRESMWLSRLHDSIQVMFDWFDYQTHAFNLNDLRFGNPLRRETLTIEDDRDVSLADIDLEHLERFTYGYHFGDGWQVEIRVEGQGTVVKGVAYPHCTAGALAAPPEDCGGLEAFHDMIECIKEPDSELGREWLAWLGPDYNPQECDLEKINKALKKLGK